MVRRRDWTGYRRLLLQRHDQHVVGQWISKSERCLTRNGDQVDDRCALRVAADHDLSLRARHGRAFNESPGVICAIDGTEKFIGRRVVDRVYGHRLAVARERSESTNACPTRPGPGGSPV